MSARSPRTVPQSRRRWFFISCGALLVTSLGLGMFLLGNNDSSKGSAPSTGEERASGAARRLPEAPGDDSHAAVAAPFANNALGTAAPRVSDVMNDWRMAIIQMNAEVVERVDQMFAARPPEFVPALMASAESDPEPRVRAFSTRVLGKLRPGESTELMHKLLADRSEYVRSNAAWALGELADHDAVARLRELAKRDPAEVVRRSATESLHKLGGG